MNTLRRKIIRKAANLPLESLEKILQQPSCSLINCISFILLNLRRGRLPLNRNLKVKLSKYFKILKKLTLATRISERRKLLKELPTYVINLILKHAENYV